MLMQFNEFPMQFFFWTSAMLTVITAARTERASLPHGLMMFKELPSVLPKF